MTSASEDNRYALLRRLSSPQDLRRLSYPDLEKLCVEIRGFLVGNVCRTGGHLGPNLGVVELTIAVHRIFDSPRDTVLFDTGHQSYVHKLLTGRANGFHQLRQEDGLSGYPSARESEHDVIENSHASVALSYADGIAKANVLNGKRERTVVAVVGDGALTGGMSWEAINNIGASDNRVVIVLNDNGRSYGPTAGSLARHLAELREETRQHNVFTELGLRYIGPVDGHEIESVEHALAEAAAFDEPVLVHCVTEKGRGYEPALEDDYDRMHAIGTLDPTTGQAAHLGIPSWTEMFGQTIADLGAERHDIVCITAAMLHPVGLTRFAREHPDRVFDVGIAEQHAVTSAAGLAMRGLHPVVAIYSTFLNRAFDQALMDVALHRLPVTFVLDRAGVTGPDGPSHHGVWDLSILDLIPTMRVAAPRDATQLAELLREAVVVHEGPTAVRYPKAAAEEAIPALRRIGGCDLLYGTPEGDVLIVAIGPTARQCLVAAQMLTLRGIRTTVVDPRWVIPPSSEVLDLVAGHDVVLTVEDSSRTGGAGVLFSQAAVARGLDVSVFNLGYPRQFLPQGSRQAIMDSNGIAPADIVREALVACSRADARRMTTARFVG
ncbi:1-deoxy-D-xylulose-5-phosphate synthase [Lentzea sp. NPDC051208]|uniref:1-deoxy-D-xylulose-5-phosphate synthase n=1 Tax=Lentzea sp. NPDC051208 TaxID=3154642 RepID=UPI003412D568